MKTQLVLSAAAACFCLASCATDPALARAQNGKTVSIGRFRVSNPHIPAEPTVPAEAVPDGTAPANAPANPVAAAPAPAPGPVAAPTPAPAPEPKPEKKSGGFFSWFKKKDPTEGAPAAVAVEEKPAEKAPAVVKKQAAPAEFREPARSPKPIDGEIRIPNLLGMPEDKDLKATNPTKKKDGNDGAVISRPPVEKKN
jgi:hypothetical protein